MDMQTDLFDQKIGPTFDGETFDPALDHDRLTKQIGRVYDLMIDGKWRTLHQISEATGDPESSVSARLRDLRKDRFGGYQVSRQRSEPSTGTWLYMLKRSGAP